MIKDMDPWIHGSAAGAAARAAAGAAAGAAASAATVCAYHVIRYYREGTNALCPCMIRYIQQQQQKQQHQQQLQQQL